MRGIFSIVIGLVMVIGGLSGKMVLIGTGSGVALAVLGMLLMASGGFRILTSNDR